MKTPHDSVRILGKDWHLVLVKGLKVPGTDDDAYGLTETWEQRISYADGMTPSQLRDTVFHELTHAVEETLGLGLEENQVHAIASGLLAVFYDNPWLLPWLGKMEASK